MVQVRSSEERWACAEAAARADGYVPGVAVAFPDGRKGTVRAIEKGAVRVALEDGSEDGVPGSYAHEVLRLLGGAS